MTYTEAKKKAVAEVIDKYTANSLDNFVRDDLKKAAEKAAAESDATAVSIADAVFNMGKEKYSGFVIGIAATCKQIETVQTYRLIRDEIIKVLK